MTMTRDANIVSEVNYKRIWWNTVSDILRKWGCAKCWTNAGELFLHEDLWDRWSRGLSFAMKMSEGPDVRETQCELCRFQSTMCFPEKGSCVKSRAECAIEELSMCCCNVDGQARDHVKNVVMNASGGLKRKIDSVKTIGSYEVGGVGEEPNVMNPDEYTNEVQCVACRISAVEFVQDCCENRDRQRLIS